MSDPIFSLAWPRELFIAEATRILELPNTQNFEGMAKHLLAEAFEDSDISHVFAAETAPPFEWAPGPLVNKPPTPRQWLSALVQDDSRLVPYRRPDYWASRNGLLPERERSDPAIDQPALTRAFEIQIIELAAAGYFPRVLPPNCVDNVDELDPSDVAIKLTNAIGVETSWPLTGGWMSALPNATLFSLVEYFHDQSQRPRITWEHEYGNCGTHFHTFNRAAGGEIYRWKLNVLLETYNIDLRLGSNGTEQGRLVKHFGSSLDDFANTQVENRAQHTDDEVAEAIKQFRSRDATLALKRASLSLLAGDLERRRPAVRAALLSKDEADLFNIANAYTIRHRKADQRDGYGAEYLDWIFWCFLSTVALMDSLEAR